MHMEKIYNAVNEEKKNINEICIILQKKIIYFLFDIVACDEQNIMKIRHLRCVS